MAVRTPLYYNSGNLQELTSTQITEIKTRMFNLFIDNPSVTLSTTGSEGNLGTISDTRLQAGAAATSISAFPEEATTEEPSIVNVNYARISQTIASDSEPSNLNNVQYPLYYTVTGELRSMTLQDMYDTFAFDTVDNLISGGEVYTIATTDTISNYTVVTNSVVGITRNYDVTNDGSGAYTFSGDISGSNPTVNATIGDTLVFVLNASGHPFWLKTVNSTGTGNAITTGTTNNGSDVATITWDTTGYSAGTYYYNCQFHSLMNGQIVLVNPPATAVFTDTRADTSQYTSGSIEETLDQPITIQNYYLHKRNATTTSYTVPAKITATGDIETPSSATFDTLLQNVIRYTAQSVTNYSIRFGYNLTNGNNCGTAMTDTRLNGSGDYQTLQVGGDDYRAQEFPNGSEITINTYNLTARKE
jgi:hypothetical protein